LSEAEIRAQAERSPFVGTLADPDTDLQGRLASGEPARSPAKWRMALTVAVESGNDLIRYIIWGLAAV
jgi:hypothetical protein